MIREGSIETIHSRLPVVKRSGEVWIGHAKVVEGDIHCSNGVIHIVDRALIPFGVSKKFPVPPQIVGPAGVQMALLPGGRFQMGSPAAEEGRRDNEGPQHIVQMDPFLIGKFEITRKQYKAVMNLDPSDTNMPGRRQLPNDDPAQRITWFDAVLFCNQLSRMDLDQPYYQLELAGRTKDGKQLFQVTSPSPFASGYRLPTEAEWEYACRARGAGAYCFGDAVEKLVEYGWYEANSGAERTRPVGMLKPNSFGLFDMHGNVAEWCHDWYFEKYAAGAEVNPQGPVTGADRVVRGGSYVYGETTLRSAARHHRPPYYSHRAVGMRVARYLPAELRPGQQQFLQQDE
jgi:formylglycine-generating enzyme required for sulfatase activity